MYYVTYYCILCEHISPKNIKHVASYGHFTDVDWRDELLFISLLTKIDPEEQTVMNPKQQVVTPKQHVVKSNQTSNELEATSHEILV